MDARQRLESLRKRKRLAELRAKQSPTPEDFTNKVNQALTPLYDGIDKPSTTESAVRGGFQGASLGFADEISGGLEALGSVVGVRGLGGKFSDVRAETDEESQQGLGDIYTQARDARRDADNEAAETNPVSYIAGGLAGGFALPGGSIKSAVTQGLAAGAGMSEADNIQDLAQDTATGGALGLLGGVAAKKLAKTGKAIDQGALRDSAGRQMLAGMKPTKGMQADLRKMGLESDVGNELLDQVGIFGLSGKEKIAKGVTDKASNIASKIDGLYDEAGKTAKISKEDLISYLRGRADELRLEPGTQPVSQQVDKFAKQVAKAKRTDYSPADVRKFRQSIDERLFKDGKLPTTKSVEKAGMSEARSVISGVEADQVGALAGARSGLNKQYTVAAKAREVANNAVDRDNTNNLFGLTSYVAGAGGGMPAMLAREFTRKFGRQLGAQWTRRADKVLRHSKFGRLLQEAGDRGGNSVAATHFLLQQSDPEYRKLMQDDD